MNAPVSTMPLWGQAWELTITNDTGGSLSTTTIASTAWEPEGLRITFDVLQAMNSSPIWYADISIYNLNNHDIQTLLLQAKRATLKAGFQTGPSKYAIIWDGVVFQSLYTREAIVDQKVTLHCIASPQYTDSTLVSFSMGPFSSQARLLASIADDTDLPPITYAQGTAGQAAQQRMDTTVYPRGNTVFGKTSKYMAQIADSNFLQSWTDGKKAYVSEVDSGKRTPDLIYAPPYPPGSIPQKQDLPPGTSQSLIGTPQQIQQGVIFTVLLDPRLHVGLPPQLVQLAQLKALTAQTVMPSPNSSLLYPLSPNLLFFVTQVRHVGDTRGSDWYTEVTGFSIAYAETLFDLKTK